MTCVKRWLGLVAICFLVGTPVAWWWTGAHRGWTQTSVAIEKEDEVTGLTYREYERRLVIGVEWLAVGMGGGLVLGAASWAVGRCCGRPRRT
jgi:hypothetical protein